MGLSIWTNTAWSLVSQIPGLESVGPHGSHLCRCNVAIITKVFIQSCFNLYIFCAAIYFPVITGNFQRYDCTSSISLFWFNLVYINTMYSDACMCIYVPLRWVWVTWRESLIWIASLHVRTEQKKTMDDKTFSGFLEHLQEKKPLFIHIIFRWNNPVILKSALL